MAAIKKGEPLTEQDLKRTLKCKSILYGRWDPDTGSYSAGISFFHGGSDQLYTFLHPHCTDRPFRKKMGKGNGSGSNRDDWMTYLVGVGVACMILIPLCNGAATHFLAKRNRTPGENRRYWQVMKKVIPVEKH